MDKIKKNIIYINFSQYDNAGRILDFLLENFEITAHFSFDHLRLKNGRKLNFLRIYRQKKLVEEKKLFSLRTPQILLFPSLPFVAIIMFLQIFIYSIKLRIKYKIDIYFSVNAFSGWTGIILKKLKIVKKTVFWVWDYFPINNPDFRLKLARWIYWKFDKPCILGSDHVVFTNKRLFNLRKKNGFLNKCQTTIIPVGTRIKKIRNSRKKVIIGFLGMLKSTQGIDLLLDSLPDIFLKFSDVKIEFIGSGPEEERMRIKAQKFKKNVKFFGFIVKDSEVEKIMKNWTIGIATYIPVSSNESYWGDPSKIKTYLGLSIPVITTNVSYFSEEIEKYKAGLIINYNQKELLKAIDFILKNKIVFQNNAYKLAKQYDYKLIYPKLFDF